MSRAFLTDNSESKREVLPDHSENFGSFADDVIGDEDDSDEDDYEKSKKRRDYEDENDEKNKVPSYMFFDFRRGDESWPANVELVDPQRAEELLTAATAAAEDAAKKKKEEDDENTKGGKSSGTSPSYSWEASKSSRNDDDEEAFKLPADATFETLRDGSKALIIKPGNLFTRHLKQPYF